MNTFHVRQSALAAMVHLAADNDIRYYLNGVFVEFNDSLTRLVATQGHSLGVYQIPALKVSDLPNSGRGSLIIPRELIERLPKNAKHDSLLTFNQSGDQNSLHWQVIVNGAEHEAINFSAIDGKYPEWRRVVNGLAEHGTTGEAAKYSLNMLNAIEKTARALCRKRGKADFQTFDLYQNGLNAALVTIPSLEHGEFEGLLMPMRGRDSDASNKGVTFDNKFLSVL